MCPLDKRAFGEGQVLESAFPINEGHHRAVENPLVCRLKLVNFRFRLFHQVMSSNALPNASLSQPPSIVLTSTNGDIVLDPTAHDTAVAEPSSGTDLTPEQLQFAKDWQSWYLIVRSAEENKTKTRDTARNIAVRELIKTGVETWGNSTAEEVRAWVLRILPVTDFAANPGLIDRTINTAWLKKNQQ
jgi:hypothetical protein